MTREEEIYRQLVELFSAVDKQPKNFEFVFSKRQLNIAKEAEERYLSSPLHQYYSAEDLTKAFRDGAEWADMHPVNVWHDASEEPICGKRLLILNTNLVVSIFNYTGKTNWSLLASCGIYQYAYISDLLPKGSTKRI